MPAISVLSGLRKITKVQVQGHLEYSEICFEQEQKQNTEALITVWPLRPLSSFNV